MKMEYQERIIFSGEKVTVRIIWPTEGYEPEDGGKSYYRRYAVLPEQTHSLNVAVVDRSSDVFPDTDGLISFNSGIPVGVVTADCVPIVLYAPDIRAIAAVHAGWKGTLGGVVDNAVSHLLEKGADPSGIMVWFGPSISGDVYEVSPEMGKFFNDAGFGDYVDWEKGRAGHPHIDLQGVNMERLERRGIIRDNIFPSAMCSFSSKDESGRPFLPSHRRSGGSPSRLLTMIEMRD